MQTSSATRGENASVCLSIVVPAKAGIPYAAAPQRSLDASGTLNRPGDDDANISTVAERAT